MATSSLLSLNGLERALGADVPTTILAATGLGVLFHLCIRKVEIDYFVWHLLAVSGVVLSGLIYGLVSLKASSLLGATARALLVAGSFNTGLAASIVVYRLFFHPLRNFPGPLGAKLSRFYTIKLAAKNCQYHLEVAKMHEKYGDFVRTGPRELCIVRKSAIPALYGSQSECLKSTWYSQVSKDCKKCSIHMTRDVDDHKRRRRAWDRAFSIKALNTYKGRIESKTNLFMKQLDARVGTPVDVTAWSNYFSFDVMGDVGFSKDFNSLASGTEHPAIKGIHDHMVVLGILSNVPWLLNILGCIPGAAAGYTSFFSWCSNEIEEKEKAWSSDENPRDLISWLLKAFKEKDVSAAPSSAALDEDARVVIIAGSDTTASSLANTLYFLAKNPSSYTKLQSHLDAAMPGGVARDWSYDKIKAVPFLDGVIHESMRLKPALMTGLYRVTPSSGLQVDEVRVPADVNVFVPIQLIQRDARYYKRPLEYVPERWTEESEGTELAAADAPFMPFSIGPYSCPGKNLAIMTLRIALASIALRYDLGFAPGETGVDFDAKAMDTFTTKLSPLRLMFTPRA